MQIIAKNNMSDNQALNTVFINFFFLHVIVDLNGSIRFCHPHSPAEIKMCLLNLTK